MQISNKIGELMEFLFCMAEHRGLMKNMYGMMNQHYGNVIKLINECEKEKSLTV